MIRYTERTFLGKEKKYVLDVIENNKSMSGDGEYTKKCSALLEDRFKSPRVLLTTSGTHALDMSALLLNINEGDEVIMPSFTFSSTATAFATRGAKIKFVDVEPRTLNINPDLIEAAITEKTKAIVPMHYAGVCCDMDKIMSIALKHNLMVIEDAAQAMMSSYRGKSAGTFGTMGCFSFHETKNYTAGEGGAIFINDRSLVERAEIIREKGTNRTKLLRGEIDKYTWVDIGSSYLPSEINAAYLYAQLEELDMINSNRLLSWNLYHDKLQGLSNLGLIDLPFIPDGIEHNAHLYFIRAKDKNQRTKLISYMKENGVQGVFHYIPLHSSDAGTKYGEFIGEDVYTTRESERLIRLPMYYNLKHEDIIFITDVIKRFYNEI